MIENISPLIPVYTGSFVCCSIISFTDAFVCNLLLKVVDLEGNVKDVIFEFTTAAAFTQERYYFPLSCQSIISAHCRSAGVGIANKLGTVFVSVSFCRTANILNSYLSLFSGYISDTHFLSYPFSYSFNYKIPTPVWHDFRPPDPAAGADWIYALPANLDIAILGISFRFVADANVAARAFELMLPWPGTRQIPFALSHIVAAGETWEYRCSLNTFAVYFLGIYSIEPMDILSWTDMAAIVSCTTTVIQVGDQFSHIHIHTKSNFQI